MVAYHPSYTHPLPENHRFPMAKYELLHQQLLREGVLEEGDFFEPEEMDEALILKTHCETYWQKLKNLQLSRLEERRSGFPVTKSLIERERRIAQGTAQSAQMALETGLGFNIAGGTHHAGSNWAEGFCLLNDQAIAANYLLADKGVQKILIIDLDVHQGNGTAQIFENEPRVYTLSVHGKNNFPFVKERSSLDIGVRDGLDDSGYLDILHKVLPGVVERSKPHFVFYLSGVDVLATDKMGKLRLTLDGCRQRDEMVYDLCRQKGLPVQTSMGGGYSRFLHEIVNAHCNTFKSALKILG